MTIDDSLVGVRVLEQSHLNVKFEHFFGLIIEISVIILILRDMVMNHQSQLFLSLLVLSKYAIK